MFSVVGWRFSVFSGNEMGNEWSVDVKGDEWSGEVRESQQIS